MFFLSFFLRKFVEFPIPINTTVRINYFLIFGIRPDNSSVDIIRSMSLIDMTISSKTGTLPPTRPVLPLCGQTARRLSLQYLRIADTSSVVFGFSTTLLLPANDLHICTQKFVIEIIDTILASSLKKLSFRTNFFLRGLNENILWCSKTSENEILNSLKKVRSRSSFANFNLTGWNFPQE